jgi:hypothetical protein
MERRNCYFIIRLHDVGSDNTKSYFTAAIWNEIKFPRIIQRTLFLYRVSSLPCLSARYLYRIGSEVR